MSEDVQFYPLPRIDADDFAEFAEILAGDEDFPNNHWRWERMLDVRKAELAEEGYTARLLDVRPAGVRRFLKESGSGASMNGLAAYAALLAAYRQ